MSTEPKTGLTYWAAGILQPDLLFNDLLLRFGATGSQPTVKDKDLSTPPGSPAAGDTYIVGPTATGAWATHENAIAYFDTTWHFFTPSEGWRVDVVDEDLQYRYSGSAWAAVETADPMSYRGAIDASANPNYPAANAGDVYAISVAGKIGGASGAVVEAGDLIICNVDGSAAGTQAAVGANWNVIQTNITYVPEDTANKSTDGTFAANSDTLFPSQKAAKTYADAVTAAATHAASSKATPVDADELPLVDSAASNVLKKLTWANLKAGVFAAWGALVAAGTSKATPVDADSFAISDSAASNATKQLTIANLKLALRMVDRTDASTTYALTAADNMTRIRFSAATTVTVTVNTGIVSNGFYCELIQDGAGQVIVVAGGGMTQRTAGTGKSRALYSPLAIDGATTTIYYVSGDMSAT